MPATGREAGWKLGHQVIMTWSQPRLFIDLPAVLQPSGQPVTSAGNQAPVVEARVSLMRLLWAAPFRRSGATRFEVSRLRTLVVLYGPQRLDFCCSAIHIGVSDPEERRMELHAEFALK